MSFATIDEGLAEIAAGRMVIVVDDEERENEGDFITAAQTVTPEAVNFISREAGIQICVALTRERFEELSIPMMVADNTAPHQTAFGVTVDLKTPTATTGSSAYDRAATIRALANPATRPGDLVRPGHVFPLRATDGGVLRRAGHTEAACDLARLAGLQPAGVLAEIVHPDGHMARLPYLQEVAARHGLKMITIKDLIAYRHQRERLIERGPSVAMPTAYGDFVCHVYKSTVDQAEYVAFVKGDVQGASDVLVRVHSQCLTGDVFRSARCDCGEQLNQAMTKIEQEGCGVVLYVMAHEGRGIGLSHKIRAYDLQDQGRDTIEANVELGFKPDLRDYGIGAQVLADLGITSMRLLTNNPAKYAGLEGYGLSVTGRVALETMPNPKNIAYLRTKRDRLGHLLEGLEPLAGGPAEHGTSEL